MKNIGLLFIGKIIIVSLFSGIKHIIVTVVSLNRPARVSSFQSLPFFLKLQLPSKVRVFLRV